MDGCLAFILVGSLMAAVWFGCMWLLTKLTIWVSMGLFNYDLSGKFWFVFGAIFLISAIFGGSRAKKG